MTTYSLQELRNGTGFTRGARYLELPAETATVKDDPRPFAVAWAETAPEGADVYCILRHVSQSGMSRVIDLAVMYNGDMRYLASLADDDRFGFKYDRKRNGFKVGGAGMDMGFHLVYSIGAAIRGNGYHFKARWL